MGFPEIENHFCIFFGSEYIRFSNRGVISAASFIYISVNQWAVYQMYGRYTLYNFVYINSFICLSIAILLLFIFRIRQCNLHVKLLITSTFAGSCSAIQQPTICGLTECTVGWTWSTSHVLSPFAFDSLTLNFSYTETSTEFKMGRYFVELYSYICGIGS